MPPLDTVQNGKGSKPRPIADRERYRAAHDYIFRKEHQNRPAPPREVGLPLLEPDGYTHQTICFCYKCKTKGVL